MDKITYLSELAEGLARWVPERERRNILDYYAEYFEEAGPDREAEVVAELGDPWALSCRLAVEGGFVTQEQAVSWTPKPRKKWPWVLAGTLAAVVIVAVSVASFMSRVGSFVGNVVAGHVTSVAERSDPMSTEAPLIDQFAESAASGSGEGGWSTVPFDAIDADISLGNITVVAGDDYTIFTQQGSTLGGYTVKWEVKGSTLKLKDSGTGKHIQVSGWEDFTELFGQSQQGLEVTITVPEMALDKISVKSGLGNVMLWGASAAKMAVETGMGNVECYEVWCAEKIKLETGWGNINLNMDDPYDGVDIDLESGLGNIEVCLGGSELDWEYELEVGLGNVTVNSVSRGSKAERKGKMPYKLEVESGKGDVNVYFQDD